MKRTLIVLGMVFALVGFMTAGQASATPTLTINGTTYTSAQYATGITVDGATFSGSLSSNPPSGTPLLDQVTLSVSGETTSAVNFALSDTGFSVAAEQFLLSATSLGSGSITGTAFYNGTEIGTPLTLTQPGYLTTNGTISGSNAPMSLDLSFATGTSGISLTSTVNPVPEPSTLLLMSIGLLGFGLVGIRKKLV